MYLQRQFASRPIVAACTKACIAVGIATATLVSNAYAQQSSTPCYANPNGAVDRAQLLARSDVRNLPGALRDVLGTLADRPHASLPTQIFAKADSPSQLFQYYLLSTKNAEPGLATVQTADVNHKIMPAAIGGNCNLPVIGAVRLVMKARPDLPADPRDIKAFIDVFTDISGLFIGTNESGRYEGWMIHDVQVPDVAAPRSDGNAQFGKITVIDAAKLQAMGNGHNRPGTVFTIDGQPVRYSRADDHFPRKQTNVLSVQLRMGAVNCMQQRDCHGHGEFNASTNWIDVDVPDQGALRQRSIPSGLANEILLDAYVRVASFEPDVPLPQRLYDAYAAEVKRVDKNNDGVISAEEGNPNSMSDDFSDNSRLFLPATSYNRFTVTRERNDRLRVPRLASGQVAWVLSGIVANVSPSIPTLEGRDGAAH